MFFNKKRSAVNTKLTLTIEQTLIEKAKHYARGKGRSFSEIVANYLKAITREDSEVSESTPITNSLRGSFKAPENFDYKEELTKGLSGKYL